MRCMHNESTCYIIRNNLYFIYAICFTFSHVHFHLFSTKNFFFFSFRAFFLLLLLSLYIFIQFTPNWTTSWMEKNRSNLCRNFIVIVSWISSQCSYFLLFKMMLLYHEFDDNALSDAYIFFYEGKTKRM